MTHLWKPIIYRVHDPIPVYPEREREIHTGARFLPNDTDLNLTVQILCTSKTKNKCVEIENFNHLQMLQITIIVNIQLDPVRHKSILRHLSQINFF